MCRNIMNCGVRFHQKGTLFFLGKIYTTTAIDHKGEKPEVVLSPKLSAPCHALIKDVVLRLRTCSVFNWFSRRRLERHESFCVPVRKR